MDPIALREFLHVLSLEYSIKSPKGARVVACLPDPTALAHASASESKQSTVTGGASEGATAAPVADNSVPSSAVDDGVPSLSL